MWFDLPDPCIDASLIDGKSPPVNIGNEHAIYNPFAAFGDDSGGAIEKYRAWLVQNPYLLRLMRQRLTGRAISGLDLSPEGFEELTIYAEIAAGLYDGQIGQEPILVFPSTLDGNHGRGFSVEARFCYGAEYGISDGPAGHSYALPVMDAHYQFLDLSAVLSKLDEFFAYAASRPFEQFRLSHFVDQSNQLDRKALEAHCIQSAPENVLLPRSWLFSAGLIPARVLVAGSHGVRDYSLVDERLDALMCRLDAPEILSTGNRGASQLGERYAVERELELRRFPAPWHRFKSDAEEIRNDRLAWEATHLVAFWDTVSSETKHLLGVCERSRIPTRVSMS